MQQPIVNRQKKFVAAIEFRVQYFPTEIRPCAFVATKDTEDFRQRIK